MKTKKSLKNKLWKLTSEYIRRKFADPHTEMCKCVTCGKVDHWKNMDCGHFVPKNKGLSVYFVEENLAPQCTYCNRFQHGNLIEYTRYIIDTYGIEKVDELRALAHTTLKLSLADYEAMIEETRHKIEDLNKTPEMAARDALKGVLED